MGKRSPSDPIVVKTIFAIERRAESYPRRDEPDSSRALFNPKSLC
jgi:hypothetical protein